MCLDRYPDHWAHCTRCHQTMAGLTAFDQHYAAGRVCAVIEAGLVAGHAALTAPPPRVRHALMPRAARK